MTKYKTTSNISPFNLREAIRVAFMKDPDVEFVEHLWSPKENVYSHNELEITVPLEDDSHSLRISGSSTGRRDIMSRLRSSTQLKFQTL